MCLKERRKGESKREERIQKEKWKNEKDGKERVEEERERVINNC